MNVKKIKIYSFIGMNLGGVTFLCCIFYIPFLIEHISVYSMMGILALVSALQGLLASLIYRIIRECNNSESTAP